MNGNLTRRDFLRGSALGAAAAAAGCRAGPRPAPPNVILVVMDTLRADHLGCHGYPVATSPALDAFAEWSTFYRRCIAPSPWTLPSHASMFTGRYPFEHGAHTYLPENGQIIEPALPGTFTTLAETLRAEGYATGAYVANAGYLATRFGMHRGFERYRAQWIPAKYLNFRIFRWLKTAEARPFFLFINYMDTHTPYNIYPRPGLIPRPIHLDPNLVAKLREAVHPADAPLPEALAQQVIDQYDVAIANLDEEIGVLLEHLMAADCYDNSLILLTSDHGEHFGEHDHVGHSTDVYEPTEHVPLMVKLPGQREGEERHEPISLVDIPRMVLGTIGNGMEERHSEAFPLIPGEHPIISENYYSREWNVFNPIYGHRYRRIRTALYDGPHKYIHSSDGEHELYDIAKDPRESKDILAAAPERASELAKALEAWQAERPRHDASGTNAPGPTPEESSTLEALGYL